MEERKIISVENINMIESIGAIPSLTEAIKSSARRSGLKEKQIAWELDIDSAHFCRIMSGNGNFPHEKFIKFMEVTSNYIPLQWMAHHCGFDLVVMQKAFEEDLRKEREEKERIKNELDSLIKFLKDIGIGEEIMKKICEKKLSS